MDAGLRWQAGMPALRWRSWQAGVSISLSGLEQFDSEQIGQLFA
jgi:hypothetical protein